MNREQITIFGEAEDDVVGQMLAVCGKSPVAHAVLCADSHLGYSVPVGAWWLMKVGFVSMESALISLAGIKLLALMSMPSE